MFSQTFRPLLGQVGASALQVHSRRWFLQAGPRGCRDWPIEQFRALAESRTGTARKVGHPDLALRRS